VLRRAALAPHGGIITGSITEDMHTSVVLHAEGWKSVYLHETLVTGLAPTDVSAFLKQRLRWAEGNLKIVHDINPLTCRGLTIPQRISYLSSIFHWTIGLPKLVFYLAPPWMLFSGSFPIAPFDRTVVTVYLVNMSCLIATYKLLSRGRGRLLMDEFFNMLNTFTLLQALGRLLFDGRKMGTFVVTDKKGGGTAGLHVLPHYLLLGFSMLALNWSMLGLGFGITDDLVGASIGVFWTLYNMAFVVGVLRLASRPPQKRDSTRFRVCVPVTQPTALGPTLTGITTDLSEGGCALRWPVPLLPRSRHALDLHLLGRTVRVTGEVSVTRRGTDKGWHVHGVSFVDPSVETVDTINDAIFDTVVPDLLAGLRRASWVVRLCARAHLTWQRRFAARSMREQVQLPARLATGTATWMVATRDVSLSGMSVVCPAPLVVGTPVVVEVLAPLGGWTRVATVARNRPIHARGRSAAAWDIGLQYAHAPDVASDGPLEREAVA
jgi:cellulose synthase (UDP-forming)